METKECLKRIVNVFSEQGFVFSKGVKVYALDQVLLQSNTELFSEPFDLNRFQGDMHWIAYHLPEVALFPWRCKAPRPILHSILGETQGVMSVVGIVQISDIDQIDIKSLFNRFDEVVLNMLRMYNPWKSDNGGTYGTLMFLFEHSGDAQRFNSSIRKNYSAHIFKNTFVSTISFDCEAETLTQGRAGLCFKWNGGIDVPKLKEHIFSEVFENNSLFDKMKDDIEEDDSSIVETIKETIKARMIITEMEKTINQIIPNANFKYPEDYLDYDIQFGLIEWIFPREILFIQDCLNHLKDSFGIENLVPFAMNGEHGKEKSTKYACFLIDGLNNDKVVTIYPFGMADKLCQREYEDVWDWYSMEIAINEIKERMKVNEKATFLGLDLIDDAPGPLVAIPKRILEGNRLIMTTDAGIWYAENDDIKNTVENYGCGLKVLSVREIENENVEVLMEVKTEETHKPLYVNGERIIPPENVCVLVTPFAGEFFVKLEAEDANGKRVLLWGDDYIYK